MRQKDNYSLKRYILFACLICAFVPIVLSIVLFTLGYKSTLENTNVKNMESTISVIETDFGLFIDEFNRITGEIAGSKVVKDSINDPENNRNQRYTELYNLSQGHRSNAYFAVYDTSGYFLYGTSKSGSAISLPTRWGVLRKAKDANGKMVSYVVKSFEYTESQPNLWLGRAIYDGEKLIGYILVGMNDKSFDKLMLPFLTGDNITIISPFFDEIYSSDSSRANALSKAEITNIITLYPEKTAVKFPERGSSFMYITEPETGFVVLVERHSDLTPRADKLINGISILIMAVSLPICILLALGLSKKIVKPFKTISEGIGTVSEGHYQVQLPVTGYKEMANLSYYFNQMTKELERYTRLLKKQKAELDDARVAQLQAQFNPHFLYNTLDTVKWLAKSHGADEISETTENLSLLLRSSINQKQIVTLEEELDLLSSYIEIQKIRFGDRFKYNIEIAPDELYIPVPKLILQSLVENAIIHGFSDGSNGVISIYSNKCNGDFYLTVEDNGVGIDQDVMKELLQSTDIKPEEGQRRSHTGLYNANKIVRLYYGEGYGLEIDSPENSGTKVTVKIALERGDSYDESSDS